MSVINSGQSDSFHPEKNKQKKPVLVLCSEKSQWNFTIAKPSNFCESRAGQIIRLLFLSKTDKTDKT